MLGHHTPGFIEADLDYRRERIASDLNTSRERFRPRWPFGLIGSRPRRPRLAPRPVAAPHHAIALG